MWRPRGWLGSKTLALKSLDRYRQCADNLIANFGKRLVCDVEAQDIAEYQRGRLAAGVANRTVNYEVGTLRGILKRFRLRSALADDVNSLGENHDVGKALSQTEEQALIDAASKSRAPALLPLLITSLDTGMRASEVRALRHGDLNLIWATALL